MMEELEVALSSLKRDVPDMFRQYLWFFVRSVRAKARIAPKRRRIIRRPNPAPPGLTGRKLRAWRKKYGPAMAEYVQKYRRDGTPYLVRLPQVARRQNTRSKLQRKFLRRKLLTISRRGLLKMSWTKVMAKLSDPKAHMASGLPDQPKARLRVRELAEKYSRVDRRDTTHSDNARLEVLLGVELKYAKKGTPISALEAHVKARKQLDYMMRYEKLTLERRIDRAIRRINKKLERAAKSVKQLTSITS